MCARALSIAKKSFRWIPDNVEETAKHIREGEEEDELERELAEFFEEDVAEDDEGRPHHRECGRGGVNGR